MVRAIALVFGTRPEAIKLAPLYLELRREEFKPLIWATAHQACHRIADRLTERI